MIRNILFDLDETLFDFSKAESMAILKTLAHFGVEGKESFVKCYSRINDSLWKCLERGEIKRDELKVKRFELFLKEININAEPAEAAGFYENELAHGHYYIEGAEELVFDLKEKYNLYLVSNGTYNVQMGRLKDASITSCFKKLFISEKIGADKPSKEFFDICFEMIPEMKKDETVIVGDSLTSDIRGGLNAGIHTVWFDRKKAGIKACQDIKPEYTIVQLAQLPPLLQKMSKSVVTCDI